MNPQRKTALLVLSGLFLFIGVIWFFDWLIFVRLEAYTEDAYVNGNIIPLMPQVAGKVIEINTDDTQMVTQGQILVKLDTADMEIELQRAKAALAETVRQVRQYFENAQQAQAVMILRRADLQKARLDLQRRVKLAGKNAVSYEEFQHYQTAVVTAQARYDDALHHLRAMQALVEHAHLYTHPLVERAKATLKIAYLNLQRAAIIAPVTGYVAKRNVQIGQQITPDTSLLAIVPLNEIWVDANYKESQLKDLRPGQPVILYADAYPDVKYHGKIFGLNPGTGAAFSLLPPQNATGNWIKIVQRLPVRVTLDPSELKDHPLQIGLSMRATTHINDTNGSRLTQKTDAGPLYTTRAYASQLSQADQLIDHILRENAPDIDGTTLNG